MIKKALRILFALLRGLNRFNVNGHEKVIQKSSQHTLGQES